MFCKYIGVNKFTIVSLTLICILFIYNYREVVDTHNALLILDKHNEMEQYVYNYVELNISTIKWNKKRISKIKQIIRRRNAQQFIRNRYQGTVIRTSTSVIVIEVRSNNYYLHSLIESLKKIIGITNSLLIFSHETYDEDINVIVRNITFAKYMQIYYPYSIQLHPNVFPGNDSTFCKYDLDCIKNDGRRIPTSAQHKHHWWWRTSFVFDHLKVTKGYDGTIVFLEEDLCLAGDFIYIIKMLEKMRPSICPHCHILNLGASRPNITQYHLVDANVIIGELGSTEELMGMAFNRSVWNSIKDITKPFCDFNDTNWTRSLVYATSTVEKYYVLTIEGPRVFRFAECTHEDVKCEDVEKVEAVRSFVRKIKRGLFPRAITIRVDDRNVKLSKGQGGWDDARDRELCKYFTRIPRGI